RKGQLVPLMPAWLKPHGRELIDRLPGVAAITSNTIRGNADSIHRIRKLAPAGIEGMEGAAFFYACLLTGTPCLQIRSVSNFVEERDKSKWNLDLALKNLNRTLHDFIIACTD
ncbi:MAG TPA: hypothetical protein PKG48_15770, partial [Bacteroidales bacterium]|nr:hypothetical protein [Bacteroidales bacterium]